MHIEPTTQRTVPPVSARRGAILSVAALACAALLGACGSSSSNTSSTATTLNTNRVAASIEQSILKERHIHATVTCPASVPQQKGRTFVCIASSHSTKTPSTVTKTPFKVTVETNKGYVTYVGE